MERIDAIKTFKTIYPEREVMINNVVDVDENHYIINASFPDGEFAFIVGNNSVSSSYRNVEDALAELKRIKQFGFM